MNTLCRWVLLFCSGCILYGLLENLLPRRGVYPVIKTVVTLYILLVVLSPVGSLGGGQLPPLPPAAENWQPGADSDLFWQKTAQALQTQLSQALADAGWQSRLLAVEVQTREDQVTGVALRLWLAPGEQAGAVQQLCDSLLDVPAAYSWDEQQAPPQQDADAPQQGAGAARQDG